MSKKKEVLENCGNGYKQSKEKDKQTSLFYLLTSFNTNRNNKQFAIRIVRENNEYLQKIIKLCILNWVYALLF